eukprot:CAMPEP_0206443176 /NCGR_PEP_ID=MMETSP0324_2-20121206/14225_1 /ASSEMBLY_ACC=CAM_ASM_000836 /TAXON_ID=2866 /ORGANISM="Crypthecodinium cohnii, Strain Seligo" /LENGTH=401 /DNA_ID=CAMNT_0053911087 /DNA_START=138 /DNA_END=1343 /DNA_ORIENTATION=+
MKKSPTFFVGADRQRQNLQLLQRREQQLAEAYTDNKPLCFSARGYQKTHPIKARRGHRDADARLEAPLILGVADGVSQIEDFGIDASQLPNELLKYCEDIGMSQLHPEASVGKKADPYSGPIPLVREAFETTESLGSTTLVLAILDNGTRIHGKLHPMLAVFSVGDCELIVLRRLPGNGPLGLVFQTEMQRIDGHVQTPLQIARVDDRIDPDFQEEITLDVISSGSAVHCVSVYEGDIVIMGSDGVFDNLFVDEVIDLANSVLLPGRPKPVHEALLGHLSKRLVEASHMKTERLSNGHFPEAPIGLGGKTDDTSCIVSEVVPWTAAHSKAWAPRRRSWQWLSPFAVCGANVAVDDGELESERTRHSKYKNPRIGREANLAHAQRDDDDDDDDDDPSSCTVS